jgi:putative transposase
MPLDQDNAIEASLCELFPTEFLRQQAEETGLIQRDRKVDPVALFWTLVLGFGIGTDRKIADLRRGYMAATGNWLCRSAFYDRFTDALVVFLRQALLVAIQSICPDAPLLSGPLSAFQDLILIDATVIRLHDLLKGAYAACRTNHTQAAAKLHLILSVLGKSEQKIKLTSGRTHESQVLRVGDWVQGRLLLFDLGYFKYALFDRIDQCRGYFVSRLKDCCNPVITAVHQTCRGNARPLLGQSLQDVLKGLKRQFLDVEVEVRFQRRAYKGCRRWVKRRFRVVGCYNSLTKAYHLYITNISPQQLTAKQIAQTYAARWIIELIFKQLKSYYQLENLPSQKQQIVEALIYTAILTLMVSKTIQKTLKTVSDDSISDQAETHFPILRTAAVLSAVSVCLLDAVLKQAGVQKAEFSLTQLILREAADPNRSRMLLLKRIQAI